MASLCHLRFGPGEAALLTELTHTCCVSHQTVGEGLFLSTSSTYAVEIAPARHRGRLGSASQFMSIVGLVLGYFSVYGSVNVEGDLAFQIPFMIQVCF